MPLLLLHDLHTLPTLVCHVNHIPDLLALTSISQYQGINRVVATL